MRLAICVKGVFGGLLIKGKTYEIVSEGQCSGYTFVRVAEDVEYTCPQCGGHEPWDINRFRFLNDPDFKGEDAGELIKEPELIYG